MPDLLDDTLRQIRARLKELAPAAAEYERLQAAHAALGGGDAEPPARRSAARSRRSGTRGDRQPAPKASAKRARRGQNKAAVLAAVSERPGVTVTELATVTGIAKPLIYNTTRAAVERGELEKVRLPGGQQGFRVVEVVAAGDAAAEQ